MRYLPVLQSTSLLRGKTSAMYRMCPKILCFNPLPSCEGRLCMRSFNLFYYKLQSTSLLRGKTNFIHNISNTWGASIHFPLAREDRKFHQKTPVFILCSCIFPPYNFLLFLQQIRISVSFVYYFFILTVRIPFRFHVHLWFAPLTSSLYILFH